MKREREKQNPSDRTQKISDRRRGVVETTAAVQRRITDQQNPRGCAHTVRYITVRSGSCIAEQDFIRDFCRAGASPACARATTESRKENGTRLALAFSLRFQIFPRFFHFLGARRTVSQAQKFLVMRAGDRC